MTIKLPTEKTSGEVDLSQIRMLIYGAPKIGKTSLVASFPDTCVAATERGYGAQKIHVVDIAKWEDFVAFVDLIIAGKHNFKTIAIDTADKLADMCVVHVCNEFKQKHLGDIGYAKGYHAVEKYLGDQLHRLFMSKYAVLLTSHSKVVEIVQDGTTVSKIVYTLSNQARKVIGAQVNTIALMKMKLFKGDDGKKVERRVLSTKSSVFEEVGDRDGRLPKEIVLSIDQDKNYAQFVKYYKEGSVKK